MGAELNHLNCSEILLEFATEVVLLYKALSGSADRDNSLSLRQGISGLGKSQADLLINDGAGFISSHTALIKPKAGHELLVFEDSSNSSPIALDRVRELGGPAAAPRLRQMQGDIRNSRDLEQAFTKAPSGIDAVIHVAGLKAV